MPNLHHFYAFDFTEKVYLSYSAFYNKCVCGVQKWKTRKFQVIGYVSKKNFISICIWKKRKQQLFNGCHTCYMPNLHHFHAFYFTEKVYLFYSTLYNNKCVCGVKNEKLEDLSQLVIGLINFISICIWIGKKMFDDWYTCYMPNFTSFSCILYTEKEWVFYSSWMYKMQLLFMSVKSFNVERFFWPFNENVILKSIKNYFYWHPLFNL